MYLAECSDLDLRANLNKCYFFKKNVTYCGHEIGSDGLKKSQDKIDAILKVKKKKKKKPENVTQLRSFLGLVQYYGKFLQNLATEARPLNELLEKTRKWKWTDQCDAAFENIKKLVTSDQVFNTLRSGAFDKICVRRIPLPDLEQSYPT